MAILPKVINRFNAILIKLPMAIFTELEQKILQFVWKHKRLRIANVILRKKNGAGGINVPDFRSSNKAEIIKTSWYLHKNRNIDQWNKTEGPEINSCTYGHLIFDKGGKYIQWRKDSLINQWCWENWTAMYKRIKLECFIIIHIKIYLKYITLQCKTRNCKVFRGKHRQYTLGHKSQKDPL